MEDLEKLTKEELKEMAERLISDIRCLESEIETAKSINPNNGNLSFDYYQLGEYRKELARVEEFLKNKE